MESQLAEIIEILKEGDSHFVLAVGSNNDWFAAIHKDEIPDVPLAWGVDDSPYGAIDIMLTNVA